MSTMPHAPMTARDGYAPHSHEVIPGHDGVAHEPLAGYPGPEGHVAGAERLLRVTDDMLQDVSEPRDLLTLAVLSLAHAVVALAASDFPAEGGCPP